MLFFTHTCCFYQRVLQLPVFVKTTVESWIHATVRGTSLLPLWRTSLEQTLIYCFHTYFSQNLCGKICSFFFPSVFTAITPWLLKAKLQSRNYKRWKTHVVRMKKWRSSLKRYLQLMYREVLKELFRFLFEELWILDSCSVRETSCP